MHITRTKLAIAIAALIGAAPLTSQAAVITLSLTGDTETTAETDTDSDSNTDTSDIYVGSDSYDNYSYASAHANAGTSGWFYSTASGNGDAFEATSTIMQQYEVENDGGDQFFDFNFDVMNGSLTVDCGDTGYGDYGDYGVAAFSLFSVVSPSYACLADEQVKAEYTASILLNGVEVWFSSASMDADSLGIDFSADGAMFGTYTSGSNYYYWGSQNYTLNLGLIAAGASFTLDYIVTTHVIGSTASNSYPYGYAQFGDPNGFSGTPVSSFSSRTADVPAPATLGLLGLGLSALLWRRNRRS